MAHRRRGPPRRLILGALFPSRRFLASTRLDSTRCAPGVLCESGANDVAQTTRGGITAADYPNKERSLRGALDEGHPRDVRS